MIAQHYGEIFDLAPIKTEEDIRNAICTVNSAMRWLEVYGINATAQSPMITFAVVRKFSTSIRREWEKYNNDPNTYPEFSSLESFLRMIAFAYEGVKASESEACKGAKSEKTTPKKSVAVTNVSVGAAKLFVCQLCAGQHLIAFCEKYLAMSVPDRYSTVIKLNLCTNCLRRNHKASECHLSNCRKCNKCHNTTLHKEEVKSESKSAAEKVKEEKVKSESQSAVVVAAAKRSYPTCLPTAIATIVVGWRKYPVRIMLGNCAQTSLVAESLVKRLRIPTYRQASVISGATPGDYISNDAATIKLASRIKQFQLEIQVCVRPSILGNIDVKIIKQLEVQLAQFDLSESALLEHKSVDIFIGVDYLSQTVTGERRIIDSLIVELTHFGWVAAGIVNAGPVAVNTYACSLIVEIQEDLKKFWEVKR